MDFAAALEHLAWSGAGALVSLSIAYVVVGKDLAYLKGSMKHVMEIVKDWIPMREKHATMVAELQNIKGDMHELKVLAHHHEYNPNGSPYEPN